MVYYSRFAGPDIYLAFFTLATAMIIWRYLADPGRGWLYLLAATLAFAVASTEMVLLVVPIFALYLHYCVARAFFTQAGDPRVDASRAPTHYERIGVAPDADVRQIRLAYKKLVDRAESRGEREALANAYHVLTTRKPPRRVRPQAQAAVAAGRRAGDDRGARAGHEDRLGGLGIADRGALAVRRLRTPAVELEGGA